MGRMQFARMKEQLLISLRKAFLRSNLANLITWSRILFVIPIVITALRDDRIGFMIVFTAHLLVDLSDGIVARGLKIESLNGEKLDTIVDFIVLVPSYFLFAYLMRDVIAGLSLFELLLAALVAFLNLSVKLVGILRLKRLPTFHLLSKKLGLGAITGYILYLCLGFNESWALYFTSSILLIGMLEELWIYLIIDHRFDEPKLVTVFQLLRRERKTAD